MGLPLESRISRPRTSTIADTFYLLLPRAPGASVDPSPPLSAAIAARLTAQLDHHLRESGDPRAIDGGDVFETYKRYSSMRRFPRPEAR